MRRRRSGAGPDLAAQRRGVVALGDAADLVGDAGPAVTAILAHMHGALGVTDEELVASGPACHGQRLDIGAERDGEAGPWHPSRRLFGGNIKRACRHNDWCRN